MRTMPGAKLRGLLYGTGLAALPVGLVAFGEGGKPYVRFVDVEEQAQYWQSVVKSCREQGTLRPEVLDAWAEMCNGVTIDMERVEIPVPDGMGEQEAFDRFWDDVFDEWAAMSIEAAHLLDMALERELQEERQILAERERL